MSLSYLKEAIPTNYWMMGRNYEVKCIPVLPMYHILVSCSEQGYDKNKVIASLKRDEVKVSDVLTQYPVEDKYIEIYLKEEIVIREAKNRGISITEQKIKELKSLIYPSHQPSQIEDFHRKQGDLIGITADEYFEIWSTTNIFKHI